MTKPKKQVPKSPASGKSLAEFMQAKRRDGCAICALPPAIREQLRGASKRHIRRADIIEWLAAEYNLTVSRVSFDSHQSGRHE